MGENPNELEVSDTREALKVFLGLKMRKTKTSSICNVARKLSIPKKFTGFSVLALPTSFLKKRTSKKVQP